MKSLKIKLLFLIFIIIETCAIPNRVPLINQYTGHTANLDGQITSFSNPTQINNYSDGFATFMGPSHYGYSQPKVSATASASNFNNNFQNNFNQAAQNNADQTNSHQAFANNAAQQNFQQVGSGYPGYDRNIVEINQAGSADRHSTHFAGDNTYIHQQNGGFGGATAGQAQNAGVGQHYGHSTGQQFNHNQNPERTIIENNYQGAPPRDSVHYVAGNSRVVQNNMAAPARQGFLANLFG
jgi:hypothetical protein